MFYRKYRPQLLSELDTQEIRDQLTSILQASSIPHAFLFTGPRGTGKTSTARIVAKVLNADVNKDGITSLEVDAKDPNVKAIAEGSSADVIEIDAASNRKIDDMRELIAQLKFAPLVAKYKIYIIDEVHMLTKEAFNALLKSLEEPPAHTIFILATTEAEALPKTIVSRCIRINFNRARNEDVIHMLERIVKGEKLKIDKESLELIAKVSDGSFRDAAKMLEVAVAHNDTSRKGIQRTLGIADTTNELLIMVSGNNVPDALRWIQSANEQGSDFRFVIEQLLNTLHLQILAKHAIGKEQEELKHMNVKQIALLISLLQKAYGQLKISPIASLPLEIAIVEFCAQQEASH